MKVQPLSKQDLPSLYELSRTLDTLSWSKNLYESFPLSFDKNPAPANQNKFQHMGFGLFDQDLRAYVLLSQLSSQAEILNFAVAPSHHNKGYGHALLSEILSALKYRHTTSVILEVAADNTPAISLYERHDFHIYASRKDYYKREQSPNIDALCLKRCM